MHCLDVLPCDGRLHIFLSMSLTAYDEWDKKALNECNVLPQRVF